MRRHWRTAWTAHVVAAGAAFGMDVLDVPAEYPTIQAAIVAAVNGDEVLVAPGTYPERIDLLGKVITVRSAGGAPVTTIDGGGAGTVVSFITAEDRATILEGFTITGGQGAFGGGIACISASPTIRDCAICSNGASLGAGLYSSKGGLLAERCTFLGNTATGDGGAVWLGCCPANNMPSEFTDCVFEDNDAARGGGVHSTGGWFEFRACRFEDNDATTRGGAVSLDASMGNILESCDFIGNTAPAGGAIAQVGLSESSLLQCNFRANRASTGSGGAVLAQSGDFAIYAIDCTFELNQAGRDGGALASDGNGVDTRRCTFSDNSARNGGAIALDIDSFIATIAGGAFTRNSASLGGAIYHEILGLTLTDAVLSQNSAGSGGGIYSYFAENQLTRCKFDQNRADYGGAIYAVDGSGTIADCFFTRNAATRLGGGVYLNELDSHSFERCTFGANTNQGLHSVLSAPSVFDSEFTSHPHGAVNVYDDGFGIVPTIGRTRFCGNDLFDICGPYDNAGGNTFAETCDCLADWDGNGALDSRDVLLYLNDWASDDPRADINMDGDVDSRDFLAFLNLWAAGC